MTAHHARRIALVRGLGVGLVVVQLLDLAIHAATGQVEPIRVAANLIIVAWALLAMADRLRGRFSLASTVSVGAYAAMNGLFLLREGVTNPDQGDQLRVAFFALVGTTLVLSALMTYMVAREQRS